MNDKYYKKYLKYKNKYLKLMNKQFGAGSKAERKRTPKKKPSKPRSKKISKEDYINLLKYINASIKLLNKHTTTLTEKDKETFLSEGQVSNEDYNEQDWMKGFYTSLRSETITEDLLTFLSGLKNSIDKFENNYTALNIRQVDNIKSFINQKLQKIGIIDLEKKKPKSVVEENKLKQLIDFYVNNNILNRKRCGRGDVTDAEQNTLESWIENFVEKYINEEEDGWVQKLKKEEKGIRKYIYKNTKAKDAGFEFVCLREEFLVDYLLDKLNNILNSEIDSTNILTINIIIEGLSYVKINKVNRDLLKLDIVSSETCGKVISNLKKLLVKEIEKLINNAENVSEISYLIDTITQLIDTAQDEINGINNIKYKEDIDKKLTEATTRKKTLENIKKKKRRRKKTKRARKKTKRRRRKTKKDRWGTKNKRLRGKKKRLDT